MNYQKLLSRFYAPTEQADRLERPVGLEEDGDCDATCPECPDCPESIPQFDERLILMNSESEPISPIECSTVEPLSVEQVRWFYKASDDKLWCEFNGYDSILIETEYRDILKQSTPPDLQSDDSIIITGVTSDERGFKSSSITIGVPEIERDVETSSPSKISRKTIESIERKFKSYTPKKDCNEQNRKIENDQDSDSSSKQDSFEEENSPKLNRIVVRGGMYEVDLLTMTCESIYWPGENYTITRGLFFYDGTWQPLERAYGEVLEAKHMKFFSNKDDNVMDKSPQPAGTALQAHHFLQFHVEWMSSSEIYLYWGGAPRQLVRSVTQKFGFYQSTGYRLRRGYKNLASLSEKPPDITHVVFVIHGIGQKNDRERIIRNTNVLRAAFDWLRIHFPSQGKNSEGRAELFPARWKVGSRGSAASLLSVAAPSGAQALRRIINDVAMDVMYYTSPIYGQEIQDDLKKELNRLYTMFMTRNPNYKGHFSAVAHSLGSVILYDIIIGHQIGCIKCSKQDEKDHTLLFPLENIFCLGSPLSVFLALRHPTPSLKNVFPQGFKPRLYNIYHLSDPVAYRMEPLISKHHARNLPVVIQPYHAVSSPGAQSSPAKGSWKIWSYVKHPWQKFDGGSPIPACSQVQVAAGEASVRIDKNNVSTEAESEYWSVEFMNLESTEQLIKDVKEKLQNQVKESEESEKPLDIEKTAIGDPLPYRLDYTIRDTMMTSTYLSAITSHTSYWNNFDIAYFILERLFPSNEDIDAVELNMTYKSQL